MNTKAVPYKGEGGRGMPPGFYFYLGLFNNGQLITLIGNKIFVKSTYKEKYLLLFNGLASILDKQYRPIGDEYIAFDYKPEILTAPPER